MDQLFKQTVHQDGQRGEADVVKCQVNTVIQSLDQTETTFQQQIINKLQQTDSVIHYRYCTNILYVSVLFELSLKMSLGNYF